MKDLVVVVIALALGVYGPQHYHPGIFDALWMLGLVVLVAYSSGQMARALRLPSLVGWMGAGLVLGASGLQLALPNQNIALHLVRDAAVVWIGFQVGLNSWPLKWLDWKRAGVLFISTLAVFILVSLGIALWVEPPWWVALLLGALACLWGPFTGRPTTRRRQVVQVGVVGAACSLLLLSVLFFALETEGILSVGATAFMGWFWVSLALGAAIVALLRLASLVPKTINGLLLGLCGTCLLVAASFQTLPLFPLPFGFAAGLVVAQQPLWRRRLRYLLHRIGPIPYVVYFALLGAALDVRVLLTPSAGLAPTLLLIVGVLVLLRGVLPAVYLTFFSLTSQRELSWLLPRGVLLFELSYAPTSGLLDFLSGPSVTLLSQVVLADILLSVLFFTILGRVFLSLTHRRTRASEPS